MKLNCPVCGAKLYNNEVCSYCKDVTKDRILNSSNKLAKQALKNKNKEIVHYTNFLPKDINVIKLWIFTILLGWIGVQNFYVGKLYKGLFHSISLGVTLFLLLLKELSTRFNWGGENGIELVISIFLFFSAIAFILYVFDVFALIFKTFKVPVVLGEKQNNVK